MASNDEVARDGNIASTNSCQQFILQISCTRTLLKAKTGIKQVNEKQMCLSIDFPMPSCSWDLLTHANISGFL
jgi:hypothetical protein